MISEQPNVLSITKGSIDRFLLFFLNINQTTKKYFNIKVSHT